MQIGKHWITALVMASVVFLAACYDDNGNSNNSGVTPPSTNNLAPSTLVNRDYTLRYSSGQLAGNIDIVRILPANTFTRTPQAGPTFQSGGNIVAPLLLSGGNIWNVQLNTLITNNIVTNVVETLVLTFSSSLEGTFTITGNGGSSAGSFTDVVVASINPPRSAPILVDELRSFFALHVPFIKPANRNHPPAIRLPTGTLFCGFDCERDRRERSQRGRLTRST